MPRLVRDDCGLMSDTPSFGSLPPLKRPKIGSDKFTSRQPSDQRRPFLRTAALSLPHSRCNKVSARRTVIYKAIVAIIFVIASMACSTSQDRQLISADAWHPIVNSEGLPAAEGLRRCKSRLHGVSMSFLVPQNLEGCMHLQGFEPKRNKATD